MDPEHVKSFVIAMNMLYESSMQSTTLRQLLRQPIRRDIYVGDSRLITTDCEVSRRGDYVRSLSRSDPEYQVGCYISNINFDSTPICAGDS